MYQTLQNERHIGNVLISD